MGPGKFTCPRQQDKRSMDDILTRTCMCFPSWGRNDGAGGTKEFESDMLFIFKIKTIPFLPLSPVFFTLSMPQGLKHGYKIAQTHRHTQWQWQCLLYLTSPFQWDWKFRFIKSSESARLDIYLFQTAIILYLQNETAVECFHREKVWNGHVVLTRFS